MRGVVWIVLLFTVAVVAATTLGSNDGIVTVYWRGWRTDLSLNLVIVALVGLCVLLTMASRAIYSVITLPRRASEWRALRKERVAQAALREALAEYFGARYSRAQKAALRALDVQRDAAPLKPDTEFTVLAQLLAAAAAHRLQDRTRRDALLAQAMPQSGRHASRADDGARLLAAEWALDDRDAGRATALLNELPAGLARRTHALRLKLQASRLERDPMTALHTARLLANHGAFSQTAAQGLLRSLAHEAIDSTHDLQQLRRVWEQFESLDRRDAFVVARAAQRAAALDAAEEGRQWLRPFWDRMHELGRDEREQLALALMETSAGIANDWLPRLESALLGYAHESAVVAAVGNAFAQRQLWGKARKLLEQTAAARTLPVALRRRALRQLAELARKESDPSRAQQFEQAAAALD